MRRRHGNAALRGSQVNTHRRVRVTATARGARNLRREEPSCLCRSGRSRRTENGDNKRGGNKSIFLFFSFFLDIPDLSYRRGGRREVEGGGDQKKKKKMKQSDASSFRGNRKRLKERDSGRPFPWNNKNLTLTGNGSASKKSLTGQ